MVENLKNKISHIGVILDGNRRYAKDNNKLVWQGHYEGGKKLKEFLQWCQEEKIKEITLYTFSMQNFNRPKDEKEKLFELFEKQLDDFIRNHQFEKNNIKINFIGRINLFPENIYKKMIKLMENTKDNSEYIINLAMAYGGREEIIDAINKILIDFKNNSNLKINEDNFKNYLYLKSEPDLIIRTGNAKRTSNFLLWQSNYSEWFFIDKMWPEFTKNDFKECISEFHSRERRFGK